jgi:hypothetical protein
MNMLYWNNRDRDKPKDKDKDNPTDQKKTPPKPHRMVDSYNFNDLFHRLHLFEPMTGTHAHSSPNVADLHNYFVGLAE